MPSNSLILPMLGAATIGVALLAGCQRESLAEPAAKPLVDTAAAPVPSQAASVAPAASPAQPKAPEPQVLQGIPNKIALPAEGAETTQLPDLTSISYVCENGMLLRVTYERPVARIAWTEGSTLTLSLAASHGQDGERYEGEGYVLRRIANVIELDQSNGSSTWRCSEGSSNA